VGCSSTNVCATCWRPPSRSINGYWQLKYWRWYPCDELTSLLKYNDNPWLSTIVFLRFLFSFRFDWEDISNTQDRVWPQMQTPQNSTKNLRCASYFQLLFVLGNVIKHGLSCLIDFIQGGVQIIHIQLLASCYRNPTSASAWRTTIKTSRSKQT